MTKPDSTMITITGGVTPGPADAEPTATYQYVAAVNEDPWKLFERWYVKPLAALEGLPNGDGGFVALATCCFLYERYAKAQLKERRAKADDDGLVDQLTADFSLPRETAERFWKIVRHGVLHQGMPMQKGYGGKLPGWAVSQDFRAPIEFDRKGTLLKVQPWLFRDGVLSLYRARPDLITCSNSFPWARVFEAPSSACTP